MMRLLHAALLLLAVALPLGAQQAARTLRLDELQDAAVRLDPRARQVALLRAQSALREANLRAEWKPALSVEGHAQYQSDVATLPFTLPGMTMSPPPNDTYDARLVARQRLLDRSVSARLDVERAGLAEAEARLEVTLFGMRGAVDEAFFGALLLQAQHAEVSTVVADLAAQHELAAERVRAGTALPSEGAMLHAELLRRRQALEEIDARRRATLEVLAALTGTPIGASDTLALPAPAGETRTAAAVDSVRARPEYRQFARSRDLLARQEAVIAAREKPRVFAFGRAGYGRPGLNPLGSEFDEYWLAGLQVEWTPWTWGTTRRERQALTLQRDILTTEEAAFTETIRRGVIQDLAAIERLEGTLVTDTRIVELREQVLREARARFREGVITSAEYIDRQTDLSNARVERARHTVELAQARARLRNRLGLED